MAIFKKVYLVDDDDLFLIVASTIMQDHDFAEEIETYEESTEALKQLGQASKDAQPDIIFLDINMQTLDGWEFLDELEKSDLPSKMDIYITSSSINPIDLNKAEENPLVKGFISKPIDIEKLKKLNNTKY